MLTGGQILVKTLQAHAVERIFCVAGESYLPVLDALLDAPDIAVTTCRQESGVTFMAESYAALENRPGVAFVTRGPGACNASIGMHTAMQSSTPLVLFVGLVATQDRDKEAFQEFDLPEMFGSLSKWAAVIDRADRIGVYTARAFHVALSGRPGPVVLGLPEDILSEEIAESAIAGKIQHRRAMPSAEAIAEVKERLASADRPLVIAGGSGWSEQDCAELAWFAGASHLPVAASFRRQDLFDHRSGNYVGELGTGPNPALIQHVKRADLILALGARLSEITTQGYSLFTPEQPLIHIYPDGREFGKSYSPALGVEARAGDLCAALAGKLRLMGGAGQNGVSLRQAYLDWTRIEPLPADRP
ncbi:MAG: thiamine pyrophosphate-binding protein [Alphaproteobacteria bacterium]